MRLKLILKNQRGFMLVEMLCAVAVLGLLWLLLNRGMMMAVRNYHDLTVAAEVQVLSGTLAEALLDDLRYARNVRTDEAGRLLSYDSDSYGEDVGFSLGDGQLLAKEQRVLPPGAYRNGKYELAALPEIKYQDGCFAVSLRVQEKGGVIYAENEFSVYCLNSQAAEATGP